MKTWFMLSAAVLAALISLPLVPAQTGEEAPAAPAAPAVEAPAAPAAPPAVEVVAAGPDRRSTYEAIAAALGFPDWFGHNADALNDCLRDWAGDGHRRALVLDGISDLERADAPGAALICAVLDDIEADNPHVLVVVVDR